MFHVVCTLTKVANLILESCPPEIRHFTRAVKLKGAITYLKGFLPITFELVNKLGNA